MSLFRDPREAQLERALSDEFGGRLMARPLADAYQVILDEVRRLRAIEAAARALMDRYDGSCVESIREARDLDVALKGPENGVQSECHTNLETKGTNP